MLDDTYYNGDRLRKFQEMMMSYKLQGFGSDVEIVPARMDMIKKHLLIDVRVYETLSVRRPDLVMYLLPWVNYIRYVEKKNILAIQYPVYDDKVTEGTERYELDDKKMSCFWYCKMYTLNPNIDEFERLEKIGFIRFVYELPGSRGKMVDGQLKITVDCVLAVDAMESKEGLKILIIGASSPLGALSGCAYEAMASMVTHSEFHLYDPYTVNCSYVLDTNKFFHYRTKFDYSTVQGYDLVCDDAWVQDQDHEMFDPNGVVFDAPNYTVKHFPWEQSGSGRLYYQVFKTNGFESRLVSRSVSFDYKYLPLGHCVGCVEMKYLLKGVYSDEFYRRFMSFHSINCLTGERHSLGDNTDLGIDMKELEVPPSSHYVSTFYRLAWDTDIKDGRVLPMNYSAIRGSRVIVSHERCLTHYVARNAIQVYKFSQGVWFCLKIEEGKFKREDPPCLKISFRDKKTGNLVSSENKLSSGGVSEMKVYDVVFKGKVTKISLRKDISMYCRRHGIAGSVTNDGLDRVSLIMKCTAVQLADFFQWIRTDGPPGLSNSLITVLDSEKSVVGSSFVISDEVFRGVTRVRKRGD